LRWLTVIALIADEARARLMCSGDQCRDKM